MRARVEMGEMTGMWRGRQPRFERLECGGTRRFFLVGRLAVGDAIRVQLASGRYEQRPRT